jgi:hypothetical protein
LLSGLGCAWDERTALAFEVSLAVRDRVEQFRRELESALASSEREKQEVDRLERELELAALEESRLRAARGAGSGAPERGVLRLPGGAKRPR